MIKVELIDILILLFILYLTYITFSLEKPKTKVQEIKDVINDIKNKNILTKKPENEFLLDNVEDSVEEIVINNVVEKPVIKDVPEQNKQITTTKPYVEVKNMNQTKNVNMLVQANNLTTIQKLN